jgi:BarA-like signal transduction histidine kinase
MSNADHTHRTLYHYIQLHVAERLLYMKIVSYNRLYIVYSKLLKRVHRKHYRYVLLGMALSTTRYLYKVTKCA